MISEQQFFDNIKKLYTYEKQIEHFDEITDSCYANEGYIANLIGFAGDLLMSHFPNANDMDYQYFWELVISNTGFDRETIEEFYNKLIKYE